MRKPAVLSLWPSSPRQALRQRRYSLCHTEEATLPPCSQRNLLSCLALTKSGFDLPSSYNLVIKSPCNGRGAFPLPHLLPSVFPPESHRLRREAQGAESSWLLCLPNLLGHKFRDKQSVEGRKGRLAGKGIQ